MSDVDLAAMYPTMAPSPAPAAAPAGALMQPAAPATPATAVPVPPHIAELRDNPETRMYPNMYSKAPWEAAFAEDLETPRAQQEAFRDEVHRMAGDVGFGTDDVRHIIDASRSMLRSPPDAAKSAEMKAEATRRLVDRFGKGAASALAGARQLAQRDPRMASMLTKTGLGNDPRTVLRLAELAVRERSRGRLK